MVGLVCYHMRNSEGVLSKCCVGLGFEVVMCVVESVCCR